MTVHAAHPATLDPAAVLAILLVHPAGQLPAEYTDGEREDQARWAARAVIAAIRTDPALRAAVLNVPAKAPSSPVGATEPSGGPPEPPAAERLTERPESPDPATAQQDRRTRYVDAVIPVSNPETRRRIVDDCMALADAEQADLKAEVERLTQVLVSTMDKAEIERLRTEVARHATNLRMRGNLDEDNTRDQRDEFGGWADAQQECRVRWDSPPEGFEAQAVADAVAQQERRERYAAAINAVRRSARIWCDNIAIACLTFADTEQADLKAEVASMRESLLDALNQRDNAILIRGSLRTELWDLSAEVDRLRAEVTFERLAAETGAEKAAAEYEHQAEPLEVVAGMDIDMLTKQRDEARATIEALRAECLALNAECTNTAEMLAEARNTIARVKALHVYQYAGEDSEGYCSRCRQTWPCPTIRAIVAGSFDSSCDGCGNAMDEGDPIARTEDGDYICGECTG